MRHIAEIQDKDSLRYVIRHELKDLGIKLPKSKDKKNLGNRQLSDKSGSGIFGQSLNNVSMVIVNEENGQTVPSFLADCVSFLENHLDTEGLFRKPGSQARQKELQRNIENGKPIPPDSHQADVAGLFKQFFRQLPDPLLTNRLLSTFIKCQQINNEQDCIYATLLLTATMPQTHVYTLSYVMRFLNKVAAHSENNKMDSANLAVVLAPNFMSAPNMDHADSKSIVAADKLLKTQTSVVHLLIDHAEKIGTIPESVLEKVYIVSNKGSDITDRFTSEDELDKSTDGDSRWRKQARRKRGKSATIHGLVNRVRSRKNSTEHVLQTPSKDDVNTPARNAAPFGNETPRILRSSKRKASDDQTPFSAAKRKALLQKMVVDPRYSKPHLNLHRTPAGFDSPITPLRPPQPSLGEVDAITQAGETLNFQSPSIKFADDSFTSFSATPAPQDAASNPSQMSLSYSTPGRKKTKKSNILSGKKKRRSFNLGTPQSQHTPRGMYQSIKRKLGHRSTHSQSLHLPNSPERGVGHRLAGEPLPEGLDTLKMKFEETILESSRDLKRTPAFRQKHRKTPSSPAILLTKSFTMCEISLDDSPCNANSVTTCDIPVDESSCNVSLLNEGLTNASLLNSSSPKVFVVDMKLHPDTQVNIGQIFEKNNDVNDDTTPVIKSKPPMKPRRSGNLTPVQTPELTGTPKEKSGKKPPMKPKRSSENLTPVRSLDILHSEESPALPPKLTSRVSLPNGESHDQVEGLIPQRDMVPSISQQSISSILSQVSMDSVKSTFSIEQNEQHMIVYDIPRMQSSNSRTGKRSPIPAALGAMPDELKEQENQTEAANPTEHSSGGRAVSMESIDSALGFETEGNVPPSQRLTKSISIDSGKGKSIDDLVSMGVLVKKNPNRFSSDAESLPFGSGMNSHPHYYDQFLSMTPTGPGSPLVKSLSTSNVNSCPYHQSTFLPTSSRLTRSQTTLRHHSDESDSALNASVVQANIQMFNSMSTTRPLSSTCGFPVSETRSATFRQDALLSRSVSMSSPEVARRRHRSDDESNRRRSICNENYQPVQKVKTTDNVLDQLKEVSVRLQKIADIDQDLSYTPKLPFHTLTALDYQEHNDSYEKAIDSHRKRYHGCLQVNIPDLGTPRSLRRALGDHNVSISPSELERFSKDVPPLAYHPHRNEALSPMKLAKSTKIRTSRGRNIIIRHSPSGRSSPGKPVKRLNAPSSGLHHRCGRPRETSTNVGRPASTRHKSSSRRYPTSPKNPVGKASPRSYPKSPSRPLAVQQYLTPRRVSSRTPSRTPTRMSSVPVHLEQEIEWRV